MHDAHVDDGLWQPVGPHRYLGQRPSHRYPIYTRGNVGEVFPEVVYPLTFSLTIGRSNDAFVRAGLATRVIGPRDVDGDGTAAFGVFGGYAYLNLSYLRMVAVRSPGLTVTDIDHQYVGNAPAPPYAPRKGDRNVLRTLAGLRATLQLLRATSLPQLEADEERAAAWRRTLPDRANASDAELLEVVRQATDLFDELFEHHITVSAQATIAGAVLKLCETKLGDSTIGLRMLAGLGDVASAAPSDTLWDLGRVVAADPALGAAFDEGVDGLWARLSADDAAADLCAQVEEFLRRFGSRGPNEWESAAPTWGTDPDLALGLVDRMRHAPPGFDPRQAHERLVDDRRAAVAEAEGRLRWLDRKVLGWLLRASALNLQGRERAKTTVVGVVHECRLALRELARRATERAEAANLDAQPHDLWFVLIDELPAYLADPAPFTARIAERRAARDDLACREPPFVFTDEQPPLEAWAWRDRAGGSDGHVDVGTILTGIAGAPGVARGRARIVHHPGEADALGPGDVLVAPLTDPAWTPLFVPAAAVVVDVGALLSHAVIVARELGIPAVVSVSDATRRIADGALVEVDGNTGRVTVLEGA